MDFTETINTLLVIIEKEKKTSGYFVIFSFIVFNLTKDENIHK